MASNIQPTGLDWKNLPDKTTPISAGNLNKMANTIDDLVEAVNPLNTVEANPVGTPTEGLEKVEIDGTLYEVKGGHKILNDSGTTLAQKDNLQFKGVYTQNNGDNTEVDICRTMTKAQMEALSGESLKGFINTSDEPDSLPLTAEWVGYGNGSIKDVLDKLDVDAIIQPKGGSSAITIASDTAILDWEAGVYHINANSDTYIPERWGTLILFRTNGVYGGAIFISTNGNIYYREFYSTNKTWYYAWQRVAKDKNCSNTESYDFPKKASEISGGNDTYTIQNSGTAFLSYVFNSDTYSQFGFTVNNLNPVQANITSGGKNLEGVRNTIAFPVSKGDKIQVSFYSSYGVASLRLRVIY